MRNLIGKLASLKITVVLVLLIAVVLSAGTILESLRGTEAGRAVYYAPWFFALQALFALNLLCALIDRWPRNRWRIGFAITHLSIIVILAGAMTTALFKREGRMPLAEGEESRVVLPDAGGARGAQTLPFAVRLRAFEVDFYPGTRTPAMFRSRVEILDPARREPVPGIIEMNHPLAWGGWHFFQSSYDVQGTRRTSILSASRDPGQPIAFVGYALLVAGMIVVFSTRLVQGRQAPAKAPGGLPTLPVLALLVAALAPAPARAVTSPDAATVKKLRALPVQHDGRTMPLDTQAREDLAKVTGTTSLWGMDPVAIVAGWATAPNEWQGYPIVKVGGDAVADAAGLPRGTRWASVAQLVSSPRMSAAVASAQAKEEADARSLSRAEKGVLKLAERVMTLYEYFTGEAIRALPSADAKGTWQPAKGARSAAELASIPERLRASGAPAHYPGARAMRREILYNEARPTRLAWLLLLPAAVLAALTVSADRPWARRAAAVLLVAGFAAMTWGLAVRWQIAGRIPAANMFESMLFLGWGVGLFGVIALALRQRLLIANAAGMGALAMMLADLLPIDRFVHPVMPVLAGTPWLAIHVPIIVVSYSVLAMATGLAHLVVGAALFAPARRDLAARWSRLLYLYIHVGSILLIAGILTGSIWAASSWGRYWGWDPKEVWSLIAFLAYMAILHARFDEEIRDFGVAVSSIAAFWTILMTYLGVNFVLASGLHSYGFGSSNLVVVMLLVAAAEVAFLLAAWGAHRRAAGLPAAR